MFISPLIKTYILIKTIKTISCIFNQIMALWLQFSRPYIVKTRDEDYLNMKSLKESHNYQIDMVECLLNELT